MDDSALQAAIEAAWAYERLHVPALFRQWPSRVLDAVQAAPGQRVLDVACGTGALAREALFRVGRRGFVSGIDPDPGMLAVAAELAPEIEWRQGTAESLPYPDHLFDVVTSQFGLMFFRDRHQAVREMLRVLKRRGALAVAVWDSLDNSAVYCIEVELLQRHAGPRAADALRAPFSLGDEYQLDRLLNSAGFDSVELATIQGTARFPSVRSMVEADLRGWLPVMGIKLDEARIELILEEAEEALEEFVTTDGHVVFNAPAHIATGTRP